MSDAGGVNIYHLLAWFVSCGLLSYVVTAAVVRIEKSKGYLAPDAHKPGNPLVPKSGGPALMVVCGVAALVALYLNLTAVAVYMFAVLLTGFLGLVDDVRGIGAIAKVMVFVAPALVPVLAHAYVPRPYLPVLNGTLRLTILYPLLFAIGYSVATNALNMADTHNGVAPIASIIVLASLLVGMVLVPRVEPLPGAFVFLMASLGGLIGYLPFNRYPAKVFNGNCGSFLMGGLLASAMALCREEFLFILLLIPLVLNGFSILSSIKGLKNKERIKVRPVVLGDDWRIRPSRNPEAPVTLVQLLILKEPLTEKEIVVAYTLLLIISNAIALIAYYALSMI